ncbi:hypothetical protein DPEC_G00355090 [Dallia pectoralis]|uniref:Uncharacterized protein n=1 Tax=Dallia pectoralis TaxID=75939 RepID=A0ACC2EZE0_DALPE|nr:hypothetical protein DPEC_G00355090 [Dallia pectoralis]
MYTAASVSTDAIDRLATSSSETVTQELVTMTTNDLSPSAGSTTEPVTVPAQVGTASRASLDSKVCLCDLTLDFCDIGCCCDIVDCDILDLSSVFNGCSEQVISGDCIERWLLFRANVDPSRVTVTNKLFCVQPKQGNTTVPQTSPALTLNAPALDDSYYFSWKGPPTYQTHTRDFYRVDDTILTYFIGSTIRGALRQPSPGAATSFCVNRNPARFLRSMSLSCTRTLTPQSCARDPSLNAKSYLTGIRLLKIPVRESVQLTPDNLISIHPKLESGWPEPTVRNGSCLNLVSQVEYILWYTIIGEIVEATVNVVLVDTDSTITSLLQKHTVNFQLATPPPTPGPTVVVGLTEGTPVIGQIGGTAQHLSILGVSGGGECSIDPRMPILFAHNTITGCTFNSPSNNCTELRSKLYNVLQGAATPSLVAMTTGSQPNWARVITQVCVETTQEEACETGCVLPHSLSVQVLWARTGLVALPQNYILGAKYLFHCQKVRCPLVSPLVVNTEVMFVDTTVYVEPPRSTPQPTWKFPFDFFSRGSGELDGWTVTSTYNDPRKVTWYLVMIALVFLGLLH